MKLRKDSDANDTILIAEDSPTQAAQLAHLLKQHGYPVRIARNGREALSLLDDCNPAIVITDVMMPELDGYGLCKAIKTSDKWNHIQVILVTTLSDALDVIRGLECGADSFIRKPYEGDYLISRIDYLLMNLELRKNQKMQMGVEISLGGQRHFISSDRQQILDLLISTYEQAIDINKELRVRERDLALLAESLEDLVEERTAELRAEIAKRQGAERYLRESEERYRLMFDRNPHPSWVFDAETLAFLAVNESAIRLYGYSRDEFLNMTILEIRPSEDVPELLRIIAEKPDGLTPEVFGVFKHKKRDGRVMDVEIASSAITLSGRPASLVLAMDVTEKLRSEEERRRMERKVHQMQRVDSLGRVAATIAHEFNNVLAGINPFAELIRRNPSVGDSGQKAVLQILSLVTRGKRVTQEILHFAQPADPELKRVDLQEWVAQLLPELRMAAGQRIAIEFEGASNPLFVRCDSAQMQQVIANLVINARDAIQGDGTITVRLESGEDQAHISVHDTGGGMPPEVLKSIFEPLFTTKRSGTGLGLAVASQIISRHSGSIDASSTPGEGTVFHILLPLDFEHSTENAGRSGKRRIQSLLFVEDDPHASEGVSGLLESKGIHVDSVSLGAEAVDAVMLVRPDAVILDVSLPDETGFRVHEQLAQRWPDLPIVVLIGSGHPELMDHASPSSNTGFLQKPYDVESLLEKLLAITKVFA